MEIIANCIPQDDLDCYYNHNWIKEQTPYKKIINNFTIIQDGINTQFYDFITNAQKGHNGVLDKLIILRDSYYHRDGSSKSLQYYVRLVQSINNITDLAIVIRHLMEYHIYTLFTIDILPNYKEPSIYTLNIGEPSLTFESKESYNKEKNNIFKMKNVLPKIYHYIREEWGYNISDENTFINNIIVIEILFSYLLLTQEESLNPHTIHNSMPYSKFLKIFDTPGNQFYKIIFQKYISPDNIVSFSNKNYLIFIKKFLSNISSNELNMVKDYLVYCIVKKYGFYTSMAPALSELPPISHTNKNFFVNLFYESFGFYLEQVYENKNADPEKFKGIKEMFSEMKLYCSSIFKNSNIFSKKTKAAAIKKLEYLEIIIGKQNYPINPKKLPMLTDDFFENLERINNFYFKNMVALVGKNINRKLLSVNNDIYSFTVNAYYDPMANTIYVPTSITHNIFYKTTASPIYNYGGLGCIIGHEIMHCFDNNGAHYDYKGHLKNWWSDDDYIKFNNELSKVEKHYSVLRINGKKINPSLSVGENIADIAGIKLSLRTYINKYLKKNSNFSKEDKNHLKLFFARWAEILRTVYYNNKSVLDSIETDAHPPSIIRINAPFSHFSEYYEIFDVTPNNFNYLSPELRSKFLEN